VNDEELLGQLKAGSNEAFGLLVDRYKDAVYHTAYHIVGDWADAEDVMQEVFVKVMGHIARFQGSSSLKTWIYRITVNCSLNWRRQIRRYLLPGRLVVAEAAHDPEPEWVILEMRRLPAKHRTVLVLRYLHDLSEKQIAEILECPVGTVKSRIHYGLARLKERLTTLELYPVFKE
jgi:RNA polymerase sigma-70 factor (ECF subfamily)